MKLLHHAGFLVRILGIAALSIPVLALLAALFCLQGTALVQAGHPPAAQDLARVRQLLSPAEVTRDGGARRTFALNERDASALLDQTLRERAAGAASIQLHPGAANLRASIPLTVVPFGTYLNIDAELRDGARMPRFEHLKIGHLPVPARLAEMATQWVMRTMASDAQAALASGIIDRIKFDSARVSVSLRLDESVARQATRALLSDADRSRLQVYQERLVSVTGKALPVMSLAELMVPVFELAAERGAQADATEENRAALVTLAMFVVGREMTSIVPDASRWPRPLARRVTLGSRDDFAKHFVLSAAIAAAAGTPVADLIGIIKEAEDARGASGFSFSDLALDRAGARFGELANRPDRAYHLAVAVSGGVPESYFMPSVTDLADGLSERELVARFGGIGGEGYRAQVSQIDSRVSALALLR